MRLVIVRGDGQGRTFKLEEGSNLIGRWDPDSGAFPEIDLEKEDLEAKISRKHAVVERKGKVVSVEDVGSRNGTFINRGPRLETGVKHELKPGDEIIVGKTFLKLEVDG